MINLVRLGNKTVSHSFPSLEVQKSTIKLNTVACIMMGAVGGSSRIDVAVDGSGDSAEIYIAAIQPDPNDPDGNKEGRVLTKSSTFSSSSIKAVLQQFRTDIFEITKETVSFEGLTWYKVKPVFEPAVSSAIEEEEEEESYA